MAGATKNEMSTSVLKTFEEKFFDMASSGNASDVKVYLKGNAPVICNHGLHPLEIAGTSLWLFVPQISRIRPALQGQSVGKTMAVFPCSLLCFSLHCHFA